MTPEQQAEIDAKCERFWNDSDADEILAAFEVQVCKGLEADEQSAYIRRFLRRRLAEHLTVYKRG